MSEYEKGKPKSKRAKPVDYTVTIHGGATFNVSDSSSSFHSNLIKDGFHHEGAWYPASSILKVERRTA